jgi:hypothetical protein
MKHAFWDHHNSAVESLAHHLDTRAKIIAIAIRIRL